MATDFLINEVEELISSGYKVQIIESDGMINLVFENFKIPNLYKKTVTTLLLRLPIAYPNCIIRSKTAINSEPWRPPNPEHVDHPFRAKTATF